MQAVLVGTQALMQRRGITEPLRFAAALSDGERLLAFRYASDGKPPSLYVSDCTHGSIVASEPLDADAGRWQSVPANSWVHVSRTGATLHA